MKDITNIVKSSIDNELQKKQPQQNFPTIYMANNIQDFQKNIDGINNNSYSRNLLNLPTPGIIYILFNNINIKEFPKSNQWKRLTDITGSEPLLCYTEEFFPQTENTSILTQYTYNLLLPIQINPFTQEDLRKYNQSTQNFE